MSEETCAICGEPVPEGRMVCPKCESIINNSIKKEAQQYVELLFFT